MEMNFLRFRDLRLMETAKSKSPGNLFVLNSDFTTNERNGDVFSVVKDLADVAELSESIIVQLFRNADQLDIQWREVSRRLNRIKHTANKLKEMGLTNFGDSCSNDAAGYAKVKFRCHSSSVARKDDYSAGVLIQRRHLSGINNDKNDRIYENLAMANRMRAPDAVGKQMSVGDAFQNPNCAGGPSKDERQMERMISLSRASKHDHRKSGQITCCQSKASQTEHRAGYYPEPKPTKFGESWDFSTINSCKTMANDYCNIVNSATVNNNGPRSRNNRPGEPGAINGAEMFRTVDAEEKHIASNAPARQSFDSSPYGELVTIKVDQRKLNQRQRSSVDEPQTEVNKLNINQSSTMKVATKDKENPKKRRTYRRNTVAVIKAFSSEDDKSCKEKTKNLAARQQGNKNEKLNDITEIRALDRLNADPKLDMQSSAFDSNRNYLEDELLYDFAPLYRRKQKTSIMQNFNQFLSLRRPKKSSSNRLEELKNISDGDDSIYKQLPAFDSEPTYGNIPRRQNSSRTKHNGFYKFFERTLSMKLLGRKKAAKESATESNYDKFPPKNRGSVVDDRSYCNDHDYANLNPRKNSKTGKLAESQETDNNANYARIEKVKKEKSGQSVKLRHSSSTNSRDSAYSSCGHQIFRPSASDASTGSIVSLDLNPNSNAGWYRPGYQVEYPEECNVVRRMENRGCQQERPNTSAEIRFSASHLRSTRPHKAQENFITARSSPSQFSPKMRQCPEISPPLSVDRLSCVESNYSCDHEGYFTSMHRDSGLWPEIDFDPKKAGQGAFGSKINKFEDFGHCASNGVQKTRYDLNKSNALSRIEADAMSCTSSKRPASNICRGRSFSTHSSTSTIAKNQSSIENNELEVKSSIDSENGYFALSWDRRSNIVHPASNLNHEAFDKWLLLRFQAEMAANSQKPFNVDHFKASGYVAAACTLPRKNVRFSE